MSSLKYFTKRTVANATTQSSQTTHFNHLRNIPRAWLIRKSKHDPKIKSVRPSDRIKWWNITPGDQIRLRGDKDSVIREVLSINRLSNRVFLKNTAVCLLSLCILRIFVIQQYSFHRRRLLPMIPNLPKPKTIIILDASYMSANLRYHPRAILRAL